jgi:hydroxymethylpyrimidine pyrophosphatase-like HAD family hydrolase
VSIKRFVALFNVAIFAVALLGTVIYISDVNIAFAQELNDEEVEKIKEEVLSYVSETRDDDPFIEVESNIYVKESNYKGITINEQTYYYSLFPHMSYDPVTRGEIDRVDVNIIYKDSDAEIPIIIYTEK